jgi:hypothetical protein
MAAAAVAMLASSASAHSWSWLDFGYSSQARLEAQSNRWFGFNKPLRSSSEEDIQRAPDQNAGDLVEAARSLKIRILTRDAGQDTDMMVPWPDSVEPTHLITCVEEGRSRLPDDRLQPAVQRIALSDGSVETILRGMSRCDGIRGTAWGTILATEVEPLTTTEEIVLDRGAPGGAATIVEADGFTPSDRIAKRPAVATLAWEGLTVTDDVLEITGFRIRRNMAKTDRIIEGAN